MKRALFMLLGAGLLLGIVGCHSGPLGRFRCAMFGSCKDCPATCQSVNGCDDCDGAAACEPGCGRGCRLGCRARRPAVNEIPPSGVVTYPYYTTRGPRDFLARSPQPIGP